jgi:hypothetical protein
MATGSWHSQRLGASLRAVVVAEALRVTRRRTQCALLMTMSTLLDPTATGLPG